MQRLTTHPIVPALPPKAAMQEKWGSVLLAVFSSPSASPTAQGRWGGIRVSRNNLPRRCSSLDLRPALLCIAAMVVCSAVAVACNIPVFRFALERWKPDTCEVIVFHRGNLSVDDEQTLRDLEYASLAKDGLANLNVIRCDLSNNADQELGNLWLSIREKMDSKVPVLVARSMKGQGKPFNHWFGSLQDARTASLIESPVRKQLVKRLQSGDAIVWLVLKSGDDQKTATVRELLQNQCDALPGKVQLPEGIGLPGSELYSEVPLLLQFSVLEIDPVDPKEQYLVRQITGFQPEALEVGEPLIVPVFGRGRALEVIPASQLNADLILDLTEYLCGACSCQVKEQNPGFDLLLSTNWNEALFGEDSEGPPPEAANGNGQKKGPELVPIPPGKKKSP